MKMPPYEVKPSRSSGKAKWVWRLQGRHAPEVEARYPGWQSGGTSRFQAVRAAQAATKGSS